MQRHNINFAPNERYIMPLARSVSAVQLLSSVAIQNEKRELGIFVGPQDEPNIKYYSLRSPKANPLVLLLVRDNAVIWCRTAYARRPIKYISSIVEFIIKQKFDIAADMASAGLVRKNGIYYNVYDLPRGFVYDGNMDLSNAGLVKLPDMSTVTILGDYDISGNYLVSLYGCPKKVGGDFYAYDNQPPKYMQHPPRKVVIGGSYYNVRPDLSR